MLMSNEAAWVPLFVDVTKRRVVIVGGGRVATRKLEKLPRVCHIVVIAPVITTSIKERIERFGGTWTARIFQPSDIQAGDLVIAALDDTKTRYAIAAAAARCGAWYNDASAVTDGDVLLPASGSWGMFTWALSTGGASPRLLKLVKDEWDTEYGMLGRVAADLLQYRDLVKGLLPTQRQREVFWRTYLPEDTLARIRRGEWAQIKEEMDNAISRLRAES